MANRWGKKWKQWKTFIFLSSKITVDGNCSCEIKRFLLLRRKTMTNLDSELKSRDITLPAKIFIVKVMLFPVVMYRCESCTIKKAECWKIDDSTTTAISNVLNIKKKIFDKLVFFDYWLNYYFTSSLWYSGGFYIYTCFILLFVQWLSGV